MFRNTTFIRSLQCIFVSLIVVIWVGCLEEQKSQSQHSGSKVTLVEKTNAEIGGYDHFSTGFELTGAHENIECESCHVNGVFEGIPTKCVYCHRQDGYVAAIGKPLDHINSTDDCESCHTTISISTVTSVDHLAVNGTCFSCHNGTTASGKTPTHITSSNTCDDCHLTTGWLPAVFDHGSVTGTCSSCHNGFTATGKTVTHVQTSAECDSCHATIAWIPAIFDHSVITGSCSSCHNGTTATGKAASHFVTSLQCDDCHNTNSWTNILFNHSSGNYPGDHNLGVTCLNCHTGNSQAATWTYGAYKPDCAGCHAGDFKSGPHKKYENPDTKYMVSELRDCSGSCHVYTDSSMSTISKSRTGKHHTSSGSF